VAASLEARGKEGVPNVYLFREHVHSQSGITSSADGSPRTAPELNGWP
jgi:hypothetical protein